MYFEITTRCNMTCAHCCSRCTAKGIDMSMKTWRAAMRFVADRGDEHVAIGGGEPTIHPRFWEILGSALGEFESVWLATNGKKTRTALALAGLARGSEVLGVALSQDRFHDPIDPIVVETFRRCKLELRDTSQHLADVGRARDNNLYADDHCVCGGLIVRANGDIRPCGCEEAPCIGNVNTGGILPQYHAALDSDEYMNSDCWTGYLRKMEETEREEAV